MKREFVLELHIVIRSEDIQKLRNTERMAHLIVNQHEMDTTYEIAGGIWEEDDGEKDA